MTGQLLPSFDSNCQSTKPIGGPIWRNCQNLLIFSTLFVFLQQPNSSPSTSEVLPLTYYFAISEAQTRYTYLPSVYGVPTELNSFPIHPTCSESFKMAHKTSAVADEPIDVLFALQSGFNLTDFAGPLEVLTTALHDLQDPSKSP